ncbi:MAG: hypothetical protein ACLU9S_04430 [Oscillospiraceae bacterium]
MGRYATFGNRRAYINYPPQMPQASFREWFRPFHKTSHIYRQYLHYGYLLGVPTEDIPTISPNTVHT